MNPFKYGQIVSKDSYCSRPELEKKLRARLLAGQNVLITGERRTGKTSLILETIRKIKTKKILYLDFLEIKSVEDIHKRVLNGIAAAEKKASVLQNIAKGLASLRPAITFDPLTGLPSISIDSAALFRPDSIEGLLGLLSGNEFKNTVVVFDEFQDVLNLDDYRQVLAVMRGKIQFLERVPFVFCGSIRNRMNMIFTDPDSPFFKSAIPMEIGPLERERFGQFILERFKKVRITVSPADISRIFQISHDNPGDTQQICSALYDVSDSGNKVEAETIREALLHIFAEEQKAYEAYLSRITALQLKCLVGVATLNGRNTLSKEFITRTGIRQPSTIRRSLQRLEDLKILFQINNEYKFVNPFFAQWLIYRHY